MEKMQDYLACKIDSAISGAIYEIEDYLDEGELTRLAAAARLPGGRSNASAALDGDVASRYA